MECTECNCLISSLENNHVDCLEKYLKIHKKYDEGWEMIETLPTIAAISNNYKMIKYLYEEGYYFAPSIYFDAYSNYNVEVIEYLIENECIGNKAFVKFYRNIMEKYKTSENILNKLLNEDIQILILSKIYKKKKNYIFNKC